MAKSSLGGNLRDSFGLPRDIGESIFARRRQYVSQGPSGKPSFRYVRSTFFANSHCIFIRKLNLHALLKAISLGKHRLDSTGSVWTALRIQTMDAWETQCDLSGTKQKPKAKMFGWEYPAGRLGGYRNRRPKNIHPIAQSAGFFFARTSLTRRRGRP